MAHNGQPGSRDTDHLLSDTRGGATSAPQQRGEGDPPTIVPFDIRVPGSADGIRPEKYLGYSEIGAKIMRFPPISRELGTGSRFIYTVTTHLNQIINHYLKVNAEGTNTDLIFGAFNHIVTLANHYNLSANRVIKLDSNQITPPPVSGDVTLNDVLDRYMKQLDAAVKKKEFPRSWRIAIAQGVGAIKEGCATPRQGITNTHDKCCAGPHSPGIVCLNITGSCPVCMRPCNAPISQNTCAKLTYNHIILILAVLLVFIALIATGQFAGNPPSPSPNPNCLPSDLGNPTLAIDWLNKTARENNVTTVENLIHLCTDVASRVDGYCPGANVNPFWIISYFLENLIVNCPS